MKLARKIEVGSNSSQSEADRHAHYLVSGIKSFSKYMGFAVSLIGLLVLSGRLLGIEQLNNPFAGLSAMEANTAIAFITAGLSLWLRGSTSPKIQTAAQVLGAITGLIGLLTLGEYVSGRNFGIDELIFKDMAASGVLYPRRMSFMSALNFTMMGMALLLFDSDNERRYNLAQSLTLVAGLIAYIALAGHLFDVDSLYRVGVFAPMAFHTALSFILLFVGIICAQPEDGWVGNLIADTLGGDLLRRLLPVAFVAPMLLGWLRLQGQRAGYYETAFGTTLLAVAITLFLSVIIWFNAKGLTRADMDRRRVEQNLRESEQRYHTLFESIDEGFCIIEKVQGEAGQPLDFRYVVANPAFAVQSGMSGVVGKTIRQAFPGEPEEWFLTYDTILRTGEPIRFERGLVTQGRVLELYAFRVEDKTHRRVAVIFKDITERKRAEQELAEFAQHQEALYKLTDQLQRTNSLGDVFNAALDAILGALQCDRASILLFDDSEVMHFVAWRGLSSNYRKITAGHSPWKPDEKNAESICINDIATGEISDSLKAVIQAEGIGSLAFIPLVSDGKLIGKFMTYYNAPHVFSSGELELSVTIARQLAFGIERKRAEGSLRESRERYRNLFDLVPVGVYACDANGRIQEFNHRAVELWGREPLKNDPKEKFCGSFKMFYTDGRFMPHDTCPMARILGGETLEPHELEILVERPDGTRHNIIAHPLLLKDESGEITGAINCFYDITARKQAEELLRESERRFREMIDALPTAIYTTDAEGLLTHFNPAVVEFSGRVPELGTDHWCVTWKLYHPDGTPLPHDQCPMAISLKEGRAVRGMEAIAERPDGTRIWFEPYPTPLRDSKGRIVGGINMLVDITERKRAEEALRESEERFHAILRQATAGIVRKDAEGKLMFVNQAFCNMLGYTESELLGKTIWQLTHNDDVEENKRLYDRTMMEGIPFKLEKRLMRKDGSTIWVDVSVSPVMDATGKPQSAVAVEVDITGRKQAEEALRDLNLQLESRVQNRTVRLQESNQSLLNEIAERQKAEEALHESRQRLQILSQRLVEVQEEERRTIARELHDSVGQSLSALNINLVILDNQISNYANEQIRTRLNDSMQLTAETISLVRDVMSDLRPSVLDDYGLEAALQSYLDQFKSRYGIKVLFEKPDEPIRRLGSSIEMTFLRIAQEALLNIARHAHADQVNLSLGQEGNALNLIVQDNGSGIESWQEANRPGSHGLTIMRERADAVGGNLRVLSIPGKGTKVEVSIPVENGDLQTVQEEGRE